MQARPAAAARSPSQTASVDDEAARVRLRPFRRRQRAASASTLVRRRRRSPRRCSDRADKRRAEDDQRKRQLQEGDGDEGGNRQRDHRPALERPLRNLDQRLEHDGEHRRLQPEQQALHQRHVADQQVDRRQRRDDHGARQHEQQPGDQPAAHAMQQPAGIGRKLHRLGPRQQHAVVQRMQEPRLVEPALFVDEDAVHQRDLAGRPAERQQPDPGEDARRLAERRPAGRGQGGVHAAAALAGQLWRSSVA